MSRKKRRPKASLFTYHRYLGLIVALFVILLSITGILLNHTESLQLNKRPVAQGWLLSVYGIASPEFGSAWKISDSKSSEQWVSRFGDANYLDGHFLQSLRGEALKGAVDFKGMVLVATSNTLALYTPEAELVDSLSLSNIERIGTLSNGRPVIESGKRYFSVNEDFTQTEKLDSLAVKNGQFIPPDTLPEQVRKALSASYVGEGLPMERVILDLHSGRLVGKIGVYFMDFVAAMMIVLTITGLTIWVRRIRRRAKRRTGQ